MQERRFVKQLGRIDDVIAFVYKRRGQIVNVKYRTVDKRFSQVSCFVDEIHSSIQWQFFYQPSLLTFVPYSSTEHVWRRACPERRSRGPRRSSTVWTTLLGNRRSSLWKARWTSWP